MVEFFYRLSMAAERKFLENFKKTYSGIVVNAHIAAYHKKLMSEFLRRIKTPFFVDPITYVFAMRFDKIQKEEHVKKSIGNLIDRYGGIVETARTRSLTPDDFKKDGKLDDSLLDDISKSVLNFQKNIISKKTQATIDELLELAELKIDRTTVKPLFLVAPYFYSESYNDEWYLISRRLAEHSKKYKEDFKLFAVVCISKSMMQGKKTAQVVAEDYKDFDGLLLWVGDFDEFKDEPSVLKSYRDFISLLRANGKPVYALYGGYFSAVLSKNTLNGYCAGICYGENKNIKSPPVTGGGVQRFYLPFTFAKESILKAAKFFTENPKMLCDCVVCGKVKKDIKFKETPDKIGEFFASLGDKGAKEHYLTNRKSEVHFIEKNDIKTLVGNLKKKYESQKNLELGEIRNSHLAKWAEALL